ncbi:histone-arginine methyltransferase METTL23-like [Amphiura filiformis]|uniref:histone-arginine methyltransferase METTL23-like n=1 Tax=Amphiura filiformis TaxID=82378 RepID=UPI003B21BD7E
MESHKFFHFEDDDETIDIKIPEVVDPSYGMYVWPCAPVLAQYVWFNRHSIRDRTVLEVGAGTSLPGVVASKCGAKVILSDDARLPKCLENCRKSCSANGLVGVEVVGITWGRFSADVISLPAVDVVLASDCFYDTKDFEDVLATFCYLLNKNKHAQCWVTYQERSSDRSIEHLLTKFDLQCTHIPLGMFNADEPHLAGSNLPGDHTIQFLLITNKMAVT